MPTGMYFMYTEIYNLFESSKPKEANQLIFQFHSALAFSNYHLDISVHFFKRWLFRQGIYTTLNVRQLMSPFN